MQKMKMRGQGATEYLTILAVILVIGVALVAIIGGFSGNASDAKSKQNEMYWQTRSPISIIGGRADSNNIAYFVLKNTGKYPVELLAIGPIGSRTVAQNTQNWNIDGMAITPDYEMLILSPELPVDEGRYVAYIAPPRGNGTGTYTQKNILNPGEQIMVGFSIWNNAAINPQEYAINQICTGPGPSGSAIEFSRLIIYYRENVNGIKVVKKQDMSEYPLILSCV
ncbi:MAG: hypothetical protein QW275_02040 [Candidatus Anstonellaceae archaeon]